MNKKQFKEITQWQRETFGEATPFSKIAHLREEIVELEDDLFAQAKDRRLEFADCFLLLFGAASADGMSYEDICLAIDEKMVINRGRSWGNPNELGVVNHIKN